MKDKKFLQWVHDRLKEVHKENVNVDYMHKLRAIVKDYPDDKITPNLCSFVASDWVSVKDKPPEGKCLVYLESEMLDRQIFSASYSKDLNIIGCYFEFDCPKVTHWMPSPETPEES